MPLTPLQRRVIAALRATRHPGSHVAGSLPLHAKPDSDRISHDIDLFHDAQAALIDACAKDEAALLAAVFNYQRTPLWTDTFRRAKIHGDDEIMEIDWAVDSAWRFFPPVTDSDFGWRLHDVDLACNKALALAGRSETRDLVDLLAWTRRFPLAAICWAACGKDPGYNPLMLLEQMRRSARIDPGDLPLLKARQLDPQALKRHWLAVATAAEASMTAMADSSPDTATGVVFLDSAGAWRWPGSPRETLTLIRHQASVGGCIPLFRTGP